MGAYRLLTDSSLYLPIWRRSGKALQRALLLALPLALVSLPVTRLYVQFILARSPFSPSDIHNANFLGVSPVQYTTWMLVLGQASMFLEWMLKRELRKSRDEVYEATVRSRGKGALIPPSSRPRDEANRPADLSTCSPAAADFWQPYIEEWRVPPIERAKRAGEKQSFYMRLSSPLMRIVLLRGASRLLPLSLACRSPADDALFPPRSSPYAAQLHPRAQPRRHERHPLAHARQVPAPDRASPSSPSFSRSSAELTSHSLSSLSTLPPRR